MSVCGHYVTAEWCPEENQWMPVQCGEPTIDGEHCRLHTNTPTVECDSCGKLVNNVTPLRDLGIVLCADCNGGTTTC
jgi:hypothetical protein